MGANEVTPEAIPMITSRPPNSAKRPPPLSPLARLPSSFSHVRSERCVAAKPPGKSTLSSRLCSASFLSKSETYPARSEKPRRTFRPSSLFHIPRLRSSWSPSPTLPFPAFPNPTAVTVRRSFKPGGMLRAAFQNLAGRRFASAASDESGLARCHPYRLRGLVLYPAACSSRADYQE